MEVGKEDVSGNGVDGCLFFVRFGTEDVTGNGDGGVPDGSVVKSIVDGEGNDEDDEGSEVSWGEFVGVSDGCGPPCEVVEENFGCGPFEDDDSVVIVSDEKELVVEV